MNCTHTEMRTLVTKYAATCRDAIAHAPTTEICKLTVVFSPGAEACSVMVV